MPEHSDFPPAEDSLHRLYRSGWSTGAAAFTGASGRSVWQVDGREVAWKRPDGDSMPRRA